MNENTKTGIFAAIAALLALATWVTLPSSATKSGKTSGGPVAGDSVFKEYDPLTASSLRIVKYNKDLAEVSDFEVAKDKTTGVWSIPSHSGYPADAEKQMSEAANAFVNLKILDVVTEKRDEHKMFGVVEPDPEKIQPGEEGIGTLVRIIDPKGNSLANIIVGATEKDNPKHRFVRIPSQDIVYIVELDVAPLTTEFTKWIEPDLLKLSSTDIQTLGIRDYSILTTNQGAVLSPNFDADVSFTTTDGKWNADSIRIREGANSTPRVLTDSEQLNATKLNEIRNALDSLRIVDVRRKPKGLAANLKAENALLEDRESLSAMIRRGFIPQKGQDGSTEIFASSGELLATLNDGVQYLVRFGNTTGESSETKAEPKEGEAPKEDSVGPQLDRYMLVTTQVDESKFPAVILKAVPESYDELLKMEAAAKEPPEAVPTAPGVDATIPVNPPVDAPEPKSAEPVKDQDKPEAEVKKEPEAAAEPKSDKSSDQANQSNDAKSTLVSFQQQEPAADAKPAPTTTPDPVAQESKVDETKPQEGKAPEVKTQDTKPEDTKSQDVKPTEKPVAETPLTDDEKQGRLDAARERITKENQRMIDERTEKLNSSKKKVAELNARFADWFYVISEAEYKRLRITLDELIQPKSAALPPGGGPGGPGGFPPGFNPAQFGPPR